MKKCIALLVSVILIISHCALQVSAYQVQPDGYITTDQFTTDWWQTDNHRENLEKKRIYGLETASFSEDLLLVFQGIGENGSPDIQDNYVNLDGELVDLNRGRFSSMSSFHEGLASFVSYDGSAGFIDKEGNIVLDTSKYNGSFHCYVSMTTRFVNGKTIVHNNDWINLNEMEKRFETEAYQESRHDVNPRPGIHPAEDWEWDTYNIPLPLYYIIDTKGNVVETVANLKALTEHPLFETAICTWQGVPLGVWMNPQEYAEPSVPETPIVSEEPEDTVVIYSRPELPEFHDADTYFKSKGKITDVVLGDMDLCSFIVNITNDTDYTDSGVIAVAAANTDNSTDGIDNSGVFFIPYYLEPHTSVNANISHRNIAHMMMFGKDAFLPNARTTAEALKGKADAAVIHFEDEDDLCNFYEMIPYEQSWKPRNLTNEYHVVCNGRAGVEFLNLLGISRPNCEEDAKHNVCRR